MYTVHKTTNTCETAEIDVIPGDLGYEGKLIDAHSSLRPFKKIIENWLENCSVKRVVIWRYCARRYSVR